jgi:uncharacterized protein YbjT (DUF2867 family)
LESLLFTGNTEVRILVRDPARATDVANTVQRAVGDLDDASSLADPFRGARLLRSTWSNKAIERCLATDLADMDTVPGYELL